MNISIVNSYTESHYIENGILCIYEYSNKLDHYCIRYQKPSENKISNVVSLQSCQCHSYCRIPIISYNNRIIETNVINPTDRQSRRKGALSIDNQYNKLILIENHRNIPINNKNIADYYDANM